MKDSERLAQYKALSERFSLIPLEGKTPRESHWERWCREKRQFKEQDFLTPTGDIKNAGIACGPASGIIVIDEDEPEKFKSLCQQNGWQLPETFTIQTGSGKTHRYYEYLNDDREYGCRSFKDAKNARQTIFDVKGVGGQVVAPGSIHPDTGKPYRIIKDSPIAPAPVWLLKEASKNGSKQKDDQHSSTKWTGDIDGLPIPKDTKKLIKEPIPQGERSEAIMKVVDALVWARLCDEEIFGVFENYPIGQKYHEKGTTKQTWLQKQIDKARAYIADGGVACQQDSNEEASDTYPDRASIREVSIRLKATIKRNKDQGKIGEKTGFRFLDRAIGGFVKTHLWIVGAYTSHGKTAFMVQLIIYALEHNPDMRIAIFSTEMSAETVLLRLLSNKAALRSLELYGGKLSHDTQHELDEALEYFNNKKIRIYDNCYTFEAINKASMATPNLDVVFVDFIQNMEAEGGIYDRMSVIPIQLQRMARELNTCVVAMSQVSNDSVRDESALIGYKGAGEIAAACDLGLWLKKDLKNPEEVRCAIRKNRHGPTGQHDLRFENSFTRLVEV